LKDKGRRDHTLTSAIHGPSSGVHFKGLTMSKILSGVELEVIVSKLIAAKAEILHLIIEEENVSEAASDLWGVIEMLQEIILKLQSLL
jgi:hypothetical protein